MQKSIILIAEGSHTITAINPYDMRRLLDMVPQIKKLYNQGVTDREKRQKLYQYYYLQFRFDLARIRVITLTETEPPSPLPKRIPTQMQTL